MKEKLLVLILIMISTGQIQAQSSYYTLLQGGANIGLINKKYHGRLNGYSASFVFGKRYTDRLLLGLGVGTERLKGTFEKNDDHPSDANRQRYYYEQDLLPVFADVRYRMWEISPANKLSLVANGGYAPSLAARYDKGLLFRVGFVYQYLSSHHLNWMLSTSYGYQELAGNKIDIGKNIQQRQLNVTFGVLLN